MTCLSLKTKINPFLNLGGHVDALPVVLIVHILVVVLLAPGDVVHGIGDDVEHPVQEAVLPNVHAEAAVPAGLCRARLLFHLLLLLLLAVRNICNFI